MEESTVESVSRPVAFGTAMLMMFINWMVIGRPDGSAWVWVEHLAADFFVLALMGGVVVTGRVRPGWWSLLRGRRPARQVSRAAQSVRDAVHLVRIAWWRMRRYK
ncbi:MAG: hypothetical protein Q8L48_15960 [Archangium sp.]|nr:hypothetical protein [Archangium sp.]